MQQAMRCSRYKDFEHDSKSVETSEDVGVLRHELVSGPSKDIGTAAAQDWQVTQVSGQRPQLLRKKPGRAES